MASQPLRRALVEALERRAHAQLGPGVTSMEYVESWLSSGKTFALLSQDIATDLGRPVSRNFVSFVCNCLTDDARSRIRAARPGRRKTQHSNGPARVPALGDHTLELRQRAVLSRQGQTVESNKPLELGTPHPSGVRVIAALQVGPRRKTVRATLAGMARSLGN
jgi:hypothetical protein